MPTIAITTQQIKDAIAQLRAKEKAKLLEELEKDTWQIRFKQLLARIDARLKKHPVSQKRLNQIIEKARQDYYDQGRH